MTVKLMTHRGVNLLVFISRCDDEAQARLQGIGEATAQGSQTVSARAIEVRGCSTTGRDAPNGRGVGAALGPGGQDSLKRGTLGRPRQLDGEQERELSKLLMAGALSCGYPTELWTLPRIGKLIAKRFGVQYST